MLVLTARAKTEIHEARWHNLQALGWSTAQIAGRYGLTDRHVRRGIQRHRLRDGLELEDSEPLRRIRVTPCYGIRFFTPFTSCHDIHPYGSITPGSSCYCETCAQFGCDGHRHVLESEQWDITATEQRLAAERAREAAELDKPAIKFKPRIKRKRKKLTPSRSIRPSMAG
jgi:hypothetical protein